VTSGSGIFFLVRGVERIGSGTYDQEIMFTLDLYRVDAKSTFEWDPPVL
jgi:hypothetical protein